ncbi:MAG: transglutaminase domain-containing protein [Steroidobacteraceae bacterium]
MVVTGLVEITWSEQALPHEGPLLPLAYLSSTALTRPTPPLVNLAEANPARNGATWEWITHLGRGVRELHPGDAASEDIAHAFLACCRAAGVPARYVSGYRQTDEEPRGPDCLGGYLERRPGRVDCTGRGPCGTGTIASLPARRRARLPGGSAGSHPPRRRVDRNPEDPRPMTYCVGMLLDTGLVFLADSRTSAGVDQINSFRKTSVFQRPGDRVMVLQVAGNLAITQAVVTLLREPRTAPPGRPSTCSPVPICSRPPGAWARRCARCIGATRNRSRNSGSNSIPA